MIIPRRIHGALDYPIGVALIALPFVLGFDAGRAGDWVPILLGVFVLALSALTDYEVGLVRVIPMRAHLLLDAGGGALLALSPWIFGFQDRVFLPHLVIGLGEIVFALLTRPVPGEVRPARPEEREASRVPRTM